MWLELEERVEMAKRAAEEGAERAVIEQELEEMDEEDESLSIRQRLAAAMIALGVRLDPGAAEVAAAKQEAA